MVRKYFALFRANWELILEYRAGMVIWILANILPLVMMTVWLSLARSGPVGSYGAGDFVSYYLAILLVRQLTTVWVAWDLDREIRLGELSPKLLRPINPIHDHIALNLADKVFRTFTVVPLIAAAALLVPGTRYATEPVHLAGFGISLAGAWAVRFLSQYCIGLLSFWITQSLALNEMWYAGLLMLGGVIAPLDLFPPGVKEWVPLLPFRYMLSLPVEILLGRLGSDGLRRSLMIQAAWVIAWWGLYKVLWKKGVRRYGAVGA